MNTAQPDHEYKILADLKPALDGYAGVPQETRLLFAGLKAIPQIQVEGLIQHGGKQLDRVLKTSLDKMTPLERIDRLSRFVISLYESPRRHIVFKKIEYFQRMMVLRLQACFGAAHKISVFDAELFEDFIWRTFFSKTLSADSKSLVVGSRFRILEASRKTLQTVGKIRIKQLSMPTYLTLDTRGYDFFIAQMPFPGRVTAGTQMVVRYHDAIPVLYPHTISNKSVHQAEHVNPLQDNMRHGAHFCCVSEATRTDLLKIFPHAEDQASVIHNMVSSEYFEEDANAELVNQIIYTRMAEIEEFGAGVVKIRSKMGQTKAAIDYLLMVSTIEPRKNHLLLVSAWERIKSRHMPDLKLIVVGNVGWDQVPILNAFKPWVEKGDLFYLNSVPSAELRVLYRNALATICPSLAEGFDYSGVEAMRCGSAVVSSDIPVHREIYRDASEYFTPYDPEQAAERIYEIVRPEAGERRATLMQKGKRVALNYQPEAIIPKWQELFARLERKAKAPKNSR